MLEFKLTVDFSDRTIEAIRLLTASVKGLDKTLSEGEEGLNEMELPLKAGILEIPNTSAAEQTKAAEEKTRKRRTKAEIEADQKAKAEAEIKLVEPTPSIEESNDFEDAFSAATEEKQPTVTIENLKTIGIKIAQAGKGAEGKAILDSYGVRRFIELPAETFGAVLKKFQALLP